MAQRVQTILVSDISGDEIIDGGETVEFAYRGATYRIDLTDEEAAEFDSAVATYLEHAQRVGGRRSSRTKSAAASVTPIDTKAVREWALSNGIEISSRGRISADVLEQYRAAGN